MKETLETEFTFLTPRQMRENAANTIVPPKRGGRQRRLTETERQFQKPFARRPALQRVNEALAAHFEEQEEASNANKK